MVLRVSVVIFIFIALQVSMTVMVRGIGKYTDRSTLYCRRHHDVAVLVLLGDVGMLVLVQIGQRHKNSMQF